jgi:hypothetical protein
MSLNCRAKGRGIVVLPARTADQQSVAVLLQLNPVPGNWLNILGDLWIDVLGHGHSLADAVLDERDWESELEPSHADLRDERRKHLLWSAEITAVFIAPVRVETVRDKHNHNRVELIFFPRRDETVLDAADHLNEVCASVDLRHDEPLTSVRTFPTLGDHLLRALRRAARVINEVHREGSLP